MSYKVIKFFHDLQDTVKTKGGEICHAYNVGDTYPREGYKPSADRIAELAGSDNKQRTPLIEQVDDESDTQNTGATADEEISAAEEVQEPDAPQEDAAETEKKPKRKRTAKAAE